MRDTKANDMEKKLYKNIEEIKYLLISIMPKIHDQSIISEITCSIDELSKFQSTGKELVNLAGDDVQASGMISRIAASLDIELSTVTDSSDERIAQIIIEDVTAQITDNIRLIREYENTACSEKALALARKVVRFEEKLVEKFKEHL